MERPPSYAFKYHQGKDAKGIGFDAECAPTLTSDWHVPAVLYDVIVIDRAAFNQGSNAQYLPHIERTQVMDTLVARGPHAVCYCAGEHHE